MKDCLSIFSLRNVLNETTRVIVSSATLIDPVIVSDTYPVLDSGIIDVDEFISDHTATYISVQISINISTAYYREVLNYKDTDTERLNQLIGSYNWDLIANDYCAVDEACYKFADLFLKFFEVGYSLQKSTNTTKR